MAAFAIDLHNHMPVPGADYRGPMETSGADVVRAALRAGVDVLGVTDHFSLAFFRNVLRAAEGTSLLVLPGTEIRLSHGEDEVHLVALFPPDRAEECFEALMGPIGFSELERRDRLHRVVVEHDPVAAARTITELGGVCVVAHVDRWFGEYRLLGRPMLARLADEVPGIVFEYIDVGNAGLGGDTVRDVTAVQSSDSHHVGEIGRRRSRIEARGLSFEGIRDALCSGARSAAAAS